MAHFQVCRNLPHAATIVRRIEYRVSKSGAEGRTEAKQLLCLLDQLHDRIVPYEGGLDPSDAEAEQATEDAARLARSLVDEIVRLRIEEDQLGKAVRNFFECLGLGEEGVEISLRAGENPGSLMRPI